MVIQLTNQMSVLYIMHAEDDSAALLDNGISHGDSRLTITVEELAKELHVSRATAYKLARDKSFYPSVRIGKRLVISFQALIRWLNEQTQGG